MEATLQLNIPLATNQLADLIRQQLTKEERLRLVSLRQIDEELEPANEEIIEIFGKTTLLYNEEL